MTNLVHEDDDRREVDGCVLIDLLTSNAQENHRRDLHEAAEKSDDFLLVTGGCRHGLEGNDQIVDALSESVSIVDVSCQMSHRVEESVLPSTTGLYTASLQTLEVNEAANM